MSGQYEEYQHAEAEGVRLTAPEPQQDPDDLPTWRFPDPLPDPLPPTMALDLIRAHIKDGRATLERLQYEASSLDVLYGYVEQTLRESAG